VKGGARKGAGRPAGSISKTKRQVITISLPPELVVWLNSQPLSQGKEIEKLILLAKCDHRI